MRWIWIDTFVEFVSGQRASAIKNVTRGEDCLDGHFPGYPVFPQTLMIEGMAQTAGILTGEARGFDHNVILAKIRKARFDDFAQPGDQLRYDAVLDSIDEQAAVTSGIVYKNDERIGQVDLIFSHLPGKTIPGLPEENFVFTEQFMSLLATFRARPTKPEQP